MNRACVRIAIVMAGVFSMGLLSANTEASVVVRMEFNYSINTTAGPLNYVDIELFDTAAPITVENFLRYVNGGHYDNTIIHRSMDAFVVQGGGFTPVVQQGTVTSLDPIVNFGPIQNEFSPTRSNVAGTIAMAKVAGDPNSATNQWFFNVGDNSANLDSQNGGFTVFGRVLGNGMELINAINNLTTYNLASEYGGAFTDVPLFNGGANFVTITKAGVLTPPVVATGNLSGFVYVDSSANGVMDGSDYVIAGAKVTLTRQGSSTPIATVYTNADGSYRFGNLPAGSYSIRMETPTFVPGQGSSGSQIVLDGNGNVVSSGTAGAVVQNSFVDIVLDEGHQGVSFNFGQSAYPVALMSARMLLNTATDPQPAVAASIASLSIGSTVDFGNGLVGETANEELVVANTDEGAALGESGLSFNHEISASPAPEPGTMALLGTGLLIAGGIAWRRRKARATAD